jgi:hypothetical protein
MIIDPQMAFVQLKQPALVTFSHPKSIHFATATFDDLGEAVVAKS